MIDYKKYFPYDNIRPEQERVLSEIVKNWDKKKYFILQCDVGTGKSGIAKTAANWCENSFIITETKQLQQQYVDDFAHERNMVSIKGKANYPCDRNGRLNCENGPCTLRKASAEPPKCMFTCKYYSLRRKALESPIVLTSYAYIFRAFDCSHLWKPRKLMVFDECHLIEDQLINFASFTIDPEHLDRMYGLFDNHPDREMHIKRFTEDGWTESNKARFAVTYEAVVNKRNELFDMMKEEMGEERPEDLDEDTLDILSKTHKLYYDIDKLYKKMEVFNYQKKDDWIVACDSEGHLTFTPLNVDSLFNKFCNNWADKFIFMSATILDTDGFIKELGIDPEQCLVVKVESSFDPSKSPIYFMPCGSMSYQNIDESLPKACQAIDFIMQKKPNDKGIIHTGNYKVADRIWNSILIHKQNHDRFLIKASEDVTNQNLLKIHERSQNTVLLSPSMTTGVDLKDDLSRFQIVVKMPFSSLGDPRTKKKSEINSDWYTCQMLKNLVQACGRSTRSAEDHSATFILDSSFRYWVTKYQKWLPKQFLQRIKGFD